MIIQRQGDNSYRVYFGVTVPEHYVGSQMDLKDVDATRGMLLSNFFHDWSDDLKQYIRSADNFRSWPLYQLPTDSLAWDSMPGLTLAGDAAHLSVPNGEGVNLAMVDAMQLAGKIEQCGLENLNKAVEQYEEDMKRRGEEHIRVGEQMERVMTHADGASGAVRAFVGRD